MKKFYSLVLMAAALLIGTNASAKVFTGSTAAELQAAIWQIMSGATTDTEIKLSQNVELNRTVWVGTQNETDAYKTVTIDLNGHNITMNGVRNDKNQRVVYIMFSLTHGELNIINTGANEAKVQLTGETADNSRIVEVFGTYRSSRWNEDGNALVGAGINTRAANGGWFSHLEIGKNVLLYADQGCLAEGIAVGVQATRKYYQDASTQVTTTYRTDLFNSTWGFAQGVRVDFWGKMDIQGAADGKVYGFSTKGLLRSALSCSNTKQAKPEVINTNHGTSYATNYYNYNVEPYNAQGQLVETVTHKLDTIDAPFVWIHPESEINVRNNGSKVAAIYAAGYAKWLVQGYAAGKTGMYVSSGTIDLEDAYVKSTAEDWEHPEGIGSANGGGSGVVLNSRDSYSGDMDFVVSGDTKIESIDGYAIEEAVNTTTIVPNPLADPSNPKYDEDADPYIPATNVSSVTIESGTIIGGNEGAIIISGPTSAATESTDPDAQSTVVVYGGNVTGSTTVGVNPDALDELMPETGNYHQTEIEVDGKTVIVISQGEDPDDHETVHGQTGAVNWKWSTAKTDAMKDSVAVETMPAGKTVLTLDELVINQDYDQTLIVKDGYSLTVGRVVMGTKAKIIVEAGGKFIVNGAQGIVAPIADNIVIKTQEGHPAYFLFNPAVTSNRHPNATVQFISKSYTKSGSYAKQRFGIPTHQALSSITAQYNNSDVATGFEYFDYSANQWKVAGYINVGGQTMDYNKMANPFDYYQMQHNTQYAGTVVTMKGELVGNVEPNLAVRGNSWNGYANSYLAPINCEEFINMIPASVQGAFYLYNIHEEGWTDWDPVTLAFAEDIQPLQPFLVRNANAATQFGIDYADAVYYPTTGETKPSNAPARLKAVKNITKAKIIVKGEECIDRVGVAEDAQFSAEFDNGYDAVKFMNEGVNMYVNADEKMAIFATDDVENTYVGFQTIKGGTYTIEFANVQGEELILIDLETGARVAMVEGNVYEFTADANSVNDYRFQITKISKVATDIENTEAVKSVKGIYTITGQYVGEMNVWNTLPAGVYVVNGEKRVK